MSKLVRLFVLFVCSSMLAVPAMANEATSVAVGFKSQNLRFNGGKVVSKDGIMATDVILPVGSGFYIGEWSTWGHERDNELDLKFGLKKPCYGFTCRVEVSPWYSSETLGHDAVEWNAELGKHYDFNWNGSLDLSARFGELQILGGKDTEIYRGTVWYTQSVIGQPPVRLMVSGAYNSTKQWWHLPLGLYTTLKPSWAPDGWGIVPSVEALVPLSQISKRETGLAFGIGIAKTF